LATAAERRRATQELRALAHPLRLRLLEEFAGEARTTMQVAAALGEPPTRLYHHVNALERAGILKLARTRQVRGTTEKYFEVARKSFGATRATRFSRGMKGSLQNLAHMMLEEAGSDLAAAITGPRKALAGSPPLALRVLLNVTPAQLADVRQKLLSLIESIQKECKRQPAPEDTLRWALKVAFAPRAKLTQE
jgi:DNA-binding transcriptional ArsR family regulator